MTFLRIDDDGALTAIYHDESPVLKMDGNRMVRRASHVEPAASGAGWEADMSPVGGPVLPITATRGESLEFEVSWINKNIIGG
jgi:hypothetical protein